MRAMLAEVIGYVRSGSEIGTLASYRTELIHGFSGGGVDQYLGVSGEMYTSDQRKVGIGRQPVSWHPSQLRQGEASLFDTAHSPLFPIFHLRILDRLPLHIAQVIHAASTERHNMVDDITRAGKFVMSG